MSSLCKKLFLNNCIKSRQLFEALEIGIDHGVVEASKAVSEQRVGLWKREGLAGSQ